MIWLIWILAAGFVMMFGLAAHYARAADKFERRNNLLEHLIKLQADRLRDLQRNYDAKADEVVELRKRIAPFDRDGDGKPGGSKPGVKWRNGPGSEAPPAVDPEFDALGRDFSGSR